MQSKWVNALVVVIVLFVAFYFYQKYKVAPEIKLDQLDLMDFEGNKDDLSQFKGKKTLLCFAASWCGPCRKELGIIAKVKEELLQDINVVVISDELPERIELLKQQVDNGFEWRMLAQPFASIGINSIPTSYLVNKKGEVVKKKVGFIDWSDVKTARHLSKLME